MKTTKNLSKRGLAMLLALVMCVGMLNLMVSPASAAGSTITKSAFTNAQNMYSGDYRTGIVSLDGNAVTDTGTPTVWLTGMWGGAKAPKSYTQQNIYNSNPSVATASWTNSGGQLSITITPGTAKGSTTISIGLVATVAHDQLGDWPCQLNFDYKVTNGNVGGSSDNGVSYENESTDKIIIDLDARTWKKTTGTAMSGSIDDPSDPARCGYSYKKASGSIATSITSVTVSKTAENSTIPGELVAELTTEEATLSNGQKGLWMFVEGLNPGTATFIVRLTYKCSNGQTGNFKHTVNVEVKGTVNQTVPSVTKTASTTTPTVGEEFDYTIKLTNDTAVDATGVSVTDVLDSKLDYVNSTHNGSYNASTRTITWSNLTVPAHSTLTLGVTVKANAAGSITNTASAKLGSSSKSGSVTVTAVEPEPETITVTFTDGVEDEDVFADQVYPNTPVRDDGDYTNLWNGSAPTRDGYTFTGWDKTTDADGNVTYTAQWEKNQGGDNGNGGNTGGDEHCTCQDCDCGGKGTCPECQKPCDGDCKCEENKENKDKEEPNPDLDVTKTVDKATVKDGETVTYTITVTNSGNVVMNHVTVTDTLPTGLTLNGTPTASAGSVSVSGNKITWTLGTLAVGSDPVTLTYTATVSNNSANAITLKNTASVGASYPLPEPELPDGMVGGAGGSIRTSDSATLTVEGKKPVLTITKVNDKLNAANDGTDDLVTHYTITVTNNSGYSLYGLDLTDTMSDPTVVLKDGKGEYGVTLTFSDYSTAPISGNENDLVHVFKLLDRNEEFANGQTVKLTYTVRVTNNNPKTTVEVTLNNKAKAGTWTAMAPAVARAIALSAPIDTDGGVYVESEEASSSTGTSGNGGSSTGGAVMNRTVYTVYYNWTGNVPAGVSLPGEEDHKVGTNVTVNGTYTQGYTVSDAAGNTYTFSGWDRGNFTMPEEDVTINGTWTMTPATTPDPDEGDKTDPEPETPADVYYTLVYNANDGTATPATKSTTQANNPSFAIQANSFTRDGYTFQGWATSADGAVEYLPGGQITISGTSQTLYAVWSEVTVEIPEEDPPLSDTPDVEIPEEDPPLSDTPDVEIPEEDPPLSDTPDVEIPEEDPPLSDLPELDIPDGDVPLAGVPDTGDYSHIWGIVALISGMGLAVLALTNKKREEIAE